MVVTMIISVVAALIEKDNKDLVAFRIAKDYWSTIKKPIHTCDLRHRDFAKEGFDLTARLLAPIADTIKEELTSKQTSLVELDRKYLWHPYTTAHDKSPLYAVKSAFENKILLEDGRLLVDGMSSWWSAIHGYNHPKIVAKIQHQVAKLSHIMFGGFTHNAAVNLAQRLRKHLPFGLSKIFFADSGSVAVEVAMKMAIQYQYGVNQKERQYFLTPYGGYHGDTFGAMSVCDPINGMHQLFRQCLDAAKEILAKHGSQIAALIIEPIVQGAGGMWFYHPEYLNGLVRLAKKAGCLVIFDEIATGFGHTGRFFATEWINTCPDILCIGKALTGGMLTLAATACTDLVADGISNNNQVFMHGPTFMANPLACAAAQASLDILEENAWPEQIEMISQTMQKYLAPCANLDSIQDVRVLGDIGVVETKTKVHTDFLVQYFVEHGVWIRPFNNLVYIMPPYISPSMDIELLCQTIYEALAKHENIL